MKTYEFNVPKLGSVYILREGAEFLAEAGEWEISGCALTLAGGLIWSTVATVAEMIITK